MRMLKRRLSESGWVKKMAISAVLLVSITLLLASIEANAEDAKGTLAEINIRLSGNIVAPACIVDPADVDKPVSLGDWAIKQLHYPSGHSEPVAFSIHLTGCSASGVTLTFIGAKDKNDNTLLALNDESIAKGLAVEIMDTNRHRIPPGEAAPRIVIDSNGNGVLEFFARYVTTAAPSAGTANADSEFTLTYD